MPKTIHVKVFNLFPEGPDTDYGPMTSETVKVTIEQSWEWDDEKISDMKESLSDLYDVSPGRIQTNEEQAAEAEHWENEAKKLR